MVDADFVLAARSAELQLFPLLPFSCIAGSEQDALSSFSLPPHHKSLG